MGSGDPADQPVALTGRVQVFAFAKFWIKRKTSKAKAGNEQGTSRTMQWTGSSLLLYELVKLTLTPGRQGKKTQESILMLRVTVL